MLSKKINFNYLRKYRPDLTRKQIKEYINFCEKHNNNDARKRQRHHIIPRNYFKYDKTITKKEYNGLMSNITNLTIKQHEQAHKILGDKKSANFLSVHRTESYKNKMKDVLNKEWNDPEYRKLISKTSRKTLKRMWKTKEYRNKMSKVLSDKVKLQNIDTNFQYNKKEKLIIDCLIDIMNNKQVISEHNWISFKKHNTPHYTQILTRYCYILIEFTGIKLNELKEKCVNFAKVTNHESKHAFFYYKRKQLLNPDDELFDIKRKRICNLNHWSEKEISKLKKYKFWSSN